MGEFENENVTRNIEHRMNRRGSMELYRPGALNEEREKHRRRGHFGESKLQNQQEEQTEENNGSRRGGSSQRRGKELKIVHLKK
jgi:hypothetical protein